MREMQELQCLCVCVWQRAASTKADKPMRRLVYDSLLAHRSRLDAGASSLSTSVRPAAAALTFALAADI